MKTLHRLYVSTAPIDRASRDTAAGFLSIPGVLRVQNSYRVDPHILDHLTLESDQDIDERSLRNYVAEPGFHNVHLVLTDAQWRALGLRPTLYGQSRVVDGQIITYGAWDERRGILHHYPASIQDFFTEDTLGEWHELDHGVRDIFGVKTPTTHAVFYGYASADSDKQSARRWVRKPYPHDAWLALPWHRLPDQTPKRPILMAIIETLTKGIARISEQISQPKYRQPFPQWSTPSQAYGVANERFYPITGHHIGTDFPTPVGTPIFAPARCEVTRTGNSPSSLGYWCEVKLHDIYLIFAHLRSRPVTGVREPGWIIAFTGDTGFTKGVHCHVEGWWEPMNRRKLGKNTWRELTFDVTTII